MPTMSTKPQPNVGMVEDDDCCYPCWKSLPDSITLHIFSFLGASSLYQVGLVCKSWLRVAFDELLWKDLFYWHWGISRSIPLAPGKYSWIQEYKRLLYHTPSVESEVLKQHGDQVLHVSFSHNGKMFATCSKDGFIRVWDTCYPTSLKYKADMRKFTWKYTQFSQFNSSDTLLLVSGVHFGSLSTSGEIAVFSLEGDFVMQSRVMNKPYDVFGTWYNDCYLLSGNLHWTGHLNSCSVLWLNKAYQETISETESVVMRLFKFSNINASSIRTIMVSNCLNHEEETVCVEKEKEPDSQSQSTSQADVKTPPVGQEVAIQNEAGNIDKDDDNKTDQAQKKKSLSKVQSIQVYENGCLCTKFVELDEEELNDKLNGTIEYSNDYRMAEGPSCIEEQNRLDSNTDTDGASSRGSSELSLPACSGSLRDMDSNNVLAATGFGLANIQENLAVENFPGMIQEESTSEMKTDFEKEIDEQANTDIGVRDREMVSCTFDDGLELKGSSDDILNSDDNVPAHFSYQVNVVNAEDSDQEGMLNLEENISYDVEFELLEREPSKESEEPKIENVPEAMDATSSVSYKRILHGQQQLQGSKFRDPTTSDIESDSPRDEGSVSSQSLSVPSSSVLCTEQSSFCCVDYKKLRKSTKANDNTEKQTVCMKLEEIPSSSGWNDSEIPSASASSKLVNQERIKGSKKHKSKKLILEDQPKAGKSEDSENIVLTTKTQQIPNSPQSDDKYLIFTKGSETYTPHQIGIKRIKPLKAFNDNGQLLPNVSENTQGLDRGEDYYDEVDHLIDMDGHIIGMCLSPDQRYLYVNSRPWPKNYHIENPLYPPPIAQEIDIHVIDLLKMREVGTMHRAHKAYTSNDECFFIFLDVCDEYVASGAEDKHGYLWDRHYGLCLKKYPHSDVVNSVAFNPVDPEVLVTVSDDFSIKIWRSLSRQKEVINAFNREHCIRLRHVRAIMSDTVDDIDQVQE